MALSALLQENSAELQELINQRRAAAQATFGKGLKQLFEDNPDLFMITKVREDSYDDSNYSGGTHESLNDPIVINGDDDDYEDWDRKTMGYKTREGYEEQVKLRRIVKAFFDVTDSAIDEAFGGWSEIKATWNRRTNSVDVVFIQ